MRRLLSLAVCLVGLASADAPRLLRVPVCVEARNGASSTLTAGALKVTVGGAQGRILRVLGPAEDLLLVLALDLTEDLSLAELAKEALASAIASLPPNVWIAVLRAQDGLKVLADPTNEREPVLRAIRELPVSGKAGLLETLPVALRLTDSILAKSAVRVALLYVTDSSIYNYREDYINPVINYSDQHDLSRRFPEGLIKEKIARLDRQLAFFQTPLYIVHLSYRNDRLNEAYQAGLLQLASGLGGDSRFCRSRQEIPEVISGVLDRLTRMYRVDIEAPARGGTIVPLQMDSEAGPLSYRTRFVFPR
ncbi:MAG: hypothetical protein ACP5U2_02210 [Bryobacteraceae bacterium]